MTTYLFTHQQLIKFVNEVVDEVLDRAASDVNISEVVSNVIIWRGVKVVEDPPQRQTVDPRNYNE